MSGEPHWEYKTDSRACEILEERCAATLAALSHLDPRSAISALADPRCIHRRLFDGLVPPEHPEFAGNYRGSEYDSLRSRVVFFAFTEAEGTTAIADPKNVDDCMAEYGRKLHIYADHKLRSLEEALGIFVPFMIFFGLVHPFLNGNGHVQRLTLQHLLERAGGEMTPEWRVHPCPYGEEMHRALAARDVSRVTSLLSPFVRWPANEGS